MNLSKLRDDIEQVTKKAMSHESHRVIVDVSQLTGWLNVLNNELETSSRDFCAACDIDLGTCDTIWAAGGGGGLYCSRECGIYAYSMMSNISKEDAEQLFNDEAEEINPTDIGLTKGDETNDDT